ncbi:MAG: DUF3971 domain-containing protein, partial [Serpentinimonas sp.]|nr:DUF3971 domain-containing protein [Serpentinimonas sp.]
VYRHAGGWDVHTPGRPGVRGAQLDFSLGPSGGQAELRLENGQIDLPGVFEQAQVGLDWLQAGVQWQVSAEGIRVAAPQVRLRNADLEAELELVWRSADPALSPARSRFPGLLELQGRLLRADAARIHRYLPLNVAADARRYLRHAVVSGRIIEAQLHSRGDLWEFPYARPGSGQFGVTAQLRDVVLDYAPAHVLAPGSPAWPGLHLSQARLQIDRTRLQIDQVQAHVRQWPQLVLWQAQAEIGDLMAYEPRFDLQARLRGPAADALAFVERSPLRPLTGAALAQAVASGAIELELGLQIPLHDTDATRVRGQLRLAGNELRLGPEIPPLQALHAVLDFTERGFDIPAARAQMLGGPLRFSGRMAHEQGAPVLHLRGQGQATALG